MTTILSHVARFRARARLVEVIRQVLVLGTLSMTLAAVWIVMMRPTGSAAWGVVGVAGAAAIVAAGVLGWWQTPLPMEVARQIDTRLRLQDHIVAAVQLEGDREPISRLIVQDALRRIDAIDPSRVFPVPIDWRIAPPVVAMVIALIVATIEVRPAIGTVGQSGVGPGGEIGADPLQRGAHEPTAAIATSPAGSTQPAGSDMASRERGAASPVPVTQTPTTPASSQATSGDPERAGSSDEADAADRTAGASSGSKDDSSAASTVATGDRGAGDRAGTSTDRNPQPTGNAASGGGGASGAAAARQPGTTQEAAGGVGASAFGPATLSGRDAAVSRESPTGIAALARSRAEAVTTRDDIPPGRRQYVRDYFLRVQRGASPQ